MPRGRKCRHCNKSIPTKKRKQAKFCDDTCKAAFHRKGVIKAERNCAHCGKQVPMDRRAHAKYCKDECKREAWKERHAC